MNDIMKNVFNHAQHKDPNRQAVLTDNMREIKKQIMQKEAERKALRRAIEMSNAEELLRDIAMSDAEETIPLPRQIINHDPATVVYWEDRSKTVAMCCEEDTYDPQIGFLVALCKRVYGRDYRHVLEQIGLY